MRCRLTRPGWSQRQAPAPVRARNATIGAAPAGEIGKGRTRQTGRDKPGETNQPSETAHVRNRAKAGLRET